MRSTLTIDFAYNLRYIVVLKKTYIKKASSANFILAVSLMKAKTLALTYIAVAIKYSFCYNPRKVFEHECLTGPAGPIDHDTIIQNKKFTSLNYEKINNGKNQAYSQAKNHKFNNIGALHDIHHEKYPKAKAKGYKNDRQSDKKPHAQALVVEFGLGLVVCLLVDSGCDLLFDGKSTGALDAGALASNFLALVSRTRNILAAALPTFIFFTLVFQKTPHKYINQCYNDYKLKNWN